MSSYSCIIVRKKGMHLEISLNRPEKRNALNKQLVDELKQSLREASADRDIRTITLTGQGSAFCSGADLGYLKELRNFSRQENLRDSLSLAELYLLIYQLPKPVVALVEGPALAGGCGLAGVCDFVLATPEAKFGYPEVKIGFIAALVSAFLIRQAGERQARELLISGRILNAQQAKACGLITTIYEKEQIRSEHEKLILQLSRNSSLAMQRTKEIFANNVLPEIETEIKKLVWLNAAFRESADFLEGISAFIDKRKPSWYVE